MKWIQQSIRLAPKPRGFHLITDDIENGMPELQSIETGLAHIFIQHTSASLTINENADPTVRMDFETHFNWLVPERLDHYRHTFEGPDDMTSHIKSSMLGSSVTVPISGGRFLLGVWQGVYLCEHRNRASGRTLIVTAFGAADDA